MASNDLRTKIFNLFVVAILVTTAFFAAYSPAAAASEWPQNFCANADGRSFNVSNPLPEKAPCSEGTTYEVVSAEKPVGTFAKDVVSTTKYAEVLTFTSGTVWAKNGAPASAPVVAAGKTSDCFNLGSRDERLICLDKTYDASGPMAWIAALGIDTTLILDARQPDEYHLAQRPDIVRGLQVNGKGTLVDPRSCVTTDEPGRILAYGVKYDRPDSAADLYGGVVTFQGPVSIWADCTDWPEFAALLGEAPAVSAPVATEPAGATDVTMSLDETIAKFCGEYGYTQFPWDGVVVECPAVVGAQPSAGPAFQWPSWNLFSTVFWGTWFLVGLAIVLGILIMIWWITVIVRAWRRAWYWGAAFLVGGLLVTPLIAAIVGELMLRRLPRWPMLPARQAPVVVVQQPAAQPVAQPVAAVRQPNPVNPAPPAP